MEQVYSYNPGAHTGLQNMLKRTAKTKNDTCIIGTYSSVLREVNETQALTYQV